VAAKNKKHKLIHLAKELKLTVSHVSDYLEQEGFEPPSTPNAAISEEMYCTVLEKYAPELFESYRTSFETVDEVSGVDADSIRREEVESILRAGGEEEEEKFTTSAMDRLRDLKVIAAGETGAERDQAEILEVRPPDGAEVPVEETAEPADASPGDPAEGALADGAAPDEAAVEADEEAVGTTTTGRELVAHEDRESEKIDLPVFKPGKVLGVEKDPEPESRPRGRKKALAEESAEGQRDPAASAMASEEKKGRRRSAKRTKSEEQHLQRLERQREERAVSAGRRRKKSRKIKISEDEIRAAVRETTRAMEGRKKRKHRKVRGVGEVNEETNVLRVTEFITTNELAELLDTPVAELIKKAFLMGTMITINQRLERELIELICDDYDYEVAFLSEFEEEEEVVEEEDQALQEPRSPVVAVMGHVDHGKTSLLDYIRESSVVKGEAGGITQHIGAYEVMYNEQKITFLDTPGHHSFTAMRARGAQATDLVVLVVAADDRVQEQTKEAIDHAKAAKVPIIVAVNKIDKPNSDAQQIRKELAEYNILVEDWGGEYQCVDISAKTGENIDKLLEEILVRAEVLELQAVAEGQARAVVIESKLDKGRGAVTTVLVQRGTLLKGDAVVAGTAIGRVRLMLDERGRERGQAPPSTPVQLLGLDSVPQAGDTLVVYTTEREARGVALKRRQIQREQSQQRISSFTSLADLSNQIAKGEIRELPVIIKGDVDGSIGAIADELMKMQTSEVRVNVIQRSVGNITENDVLLAKASGSVIIGFHVNLTPNARELAQRERVDVRLYRVIYEVVEEIHAALEGLLRPDVEEEIVGTAEVRQVFRIAKKAIAGCMVVNGKIERTRTARVIRENSVIHDGEVVGLKRFKEDVKEVQQGFECGIQLSGYNDLQEGDMIQVYTMKEVLRRLDLSAGDA